MISTGSPRELVYISSQTTIWKLSVFLVFLVQDEEVDRLVTEHEVATETELQMKSKTWLQKNEFSCSKRSWYTLHRGCWTSLTWCE